MQIISDPTVRQHQVQQKYLRAWGDPSQRLWVYRKKEEKLFLSKTTNVFAINEYYKLNPINEREKRYLLYWFEDAGLTNFVANNPILTLDHVLLGMQDILGRWREVENLKRDLFLHSIDVLIFCAAAIGVIEKSHIPVELYQTVNDRILRNIAMQSIETLYCAVEGSGMPAITKILDEENILEDDVWGLVNYISVQYFRTTLVGDVIENLVLPGVEMKSIRSIQQLIMGLKFSNNMNSRKNHIQLLENVTSVRFITGSQPVINSYATPGKMPEMLQLFFPISPNRALLVTPDKDRPFSKQEVEDIPTIDTFNRKIIHYSDILAAKEKEDIERYFPISQTFTGK